jgi:kynurenine formamidase
VSHGRGNWGRWGPDDERGAMNLVTADAVRAALMLPRRGVVYPLGQPIQTVGVPMGSLRRPRPLHVCFQDGGDFAAGEPLQDGAGAADDYLGLPVHAAATHVDALGHVWTGESLFNGHSSTTVRSDGLRRCGIEKMPPLLTRGVLLDVASVRGVAALGDGEAITPDDLEKTIRARGVEPAAGDAVLLRTGWSTVWAEDPTRYGESSPGLSVDAASMLAERDVVLVGADNIGVEAIPFPPGTSMPVHQMLIGSYGIHLLELLDLEDLARDEVTEFLFVLAPLRISGGTGSPVNPIAVA